MLDPARPLLPRGLTWLALVSAVACLPADPPGGPKRRSVGLASSQTTRAGRRPGPLEAPRAALIEEAFADDFERTTLGPSYRSRYAGWRIVAGRLCVQGARNRPLWLLPRLPKNADIEFDATSGSDEGDIKVELWGDGKSSATTGSYTDATSYLVIFGGWRNSLHVLARRDEHGADRAFLRLEPSSQDPRNAPVEAARSYHFRIERRDGKTLSWFIDERPLLSFADPEPLSGPGHEHFAFNDWETPVCFDNLHITAGED